MLCSARQERKTYADKDFDPICLRGKHWELIKLDFTTLLS